jgi:hypothetical protein
MSQNYYYPVTFFYEKEVIVSIIIHIITVLLVVHWRGHAREASISSVTYCSLAF